LYALVLSKKENPKLPTIAETERELGLVYGRLGDFVKSIDHLNSSLEIYENQDDEKNVTLVLIDLGSKNSL